MEDRRNKNLECLFRRFKGQPVEICTDDGTRYCGVDLGPSDESVEIIDSHSRVIFIPFRKIDAVIEPMMALNRFCAKDDCQCHCERNGCDDEWTDD